jgi:hypothetical protein
VYLDLEGAKGELAAYPLPAYFLDFETISFAVPIWAGTRPYQQIPFQFSVHRLAADGSLDHSEFLDISGSDPSGILAERLLEACGTSGPVFAYNAAFESTRIADLGSRFQHLQGELAALRSRLVDLLPVVARRFYHPSQQGSWSLKQVLPALVPALSYAALDGVADGQMAQDAFLEAIAEKTTTERRNELRNQLLAYCKLDTLATVRIWEALNRDEKSS